MTDADIIRRYKELATDDVASVKPAIVRISQESGYDYDAVRAVIVRHILGRGAG